MQAVPLSEKATGCMRQAMAATFIILSTSSVYAADGSLQQIRDTLKEQFRSIRSLDVEYSVDFVTTEPELTASCQRDYEWCVDDDKRMTFCNIPADPQTWSVKAFDGKWSQTAMLTSLEPRQVRFLNRFRGNHPPMLHQPEYALAFGFAFLNEPGNLSTILEDPEVRVVGSEAVDGHDCLKVESAKVPARSPGRAYRYTVWLDRKVRWLPRRLVCRIDPSSKDYESLTSHGQQHADITDFRLKEFGWFPDSVLNRDRPLPTKFVNMTTMGTSTVEVKSISVNMPIAAERFKVLPTFGAEIVEGAYPKDPFARRWVHRGGEVELP